MYVYSSNFKVKYAEFQAIFCLAPNKASGYKVSFEVQYLNPLKLGDSDYIQHLFLGLEYDALGGWYQDF